MQCAQSRPNYLAERIHNAISGAGTKDRALIRLVVSRCDVDMGNIKRAYQLKYGRTVEADISVSVQIMKFGKNYLITWCFFLLKG